MSKTKEVIRAGAMLSAVALAGRAVALFYSGFVSEHVGAEGVGLFTLIMNVYAFAVTFGSAGLSLAATGLVASSLGEGREGRLGCVLRTALLYALVLSGAATLALLLFADPIATGVIGDGRAVLPLRILALSLFPTALVAVLQGYFVGVRRVGNNALVQVLSQGAKILLTVLLFTAFGSVGVERACVLLAAIATLTDGACALLLTALLLRARRGAPRESGWLLRPFGEISLPVALSATVRQALLTVEHALIPNALVRYGNSRTQALAQYGVLHGMALPVLLFPMATLSSFSGLLVPEFAECRAAGDTSRMRRMAERALSLTFAFGCVSAVFFALFAEPLGHRLYGSAEAGAYITALAVVVPLMYFDHVTDAMLKGIGEQVYSMWVNISDSLLSILLVALLLPRFGIYGYVAVIICMEGYNLALSFWRLGRRIPFSLTVGRTVVLPLSASLGAGVLTHCLFSPNGSTVPLPWFLLETVFYLCMTLAIYLLFSLALEKQKKRLPD